MSERLMPCWVFRYEALVARGMAVVRRLLAEQEKTT